MKLKAYYTNYSQPSVSSGFQVEQLDRYEGSVSLISGTLQVFIKGLPTTAEAALKHVGDFPANMEGGVLFSIPFNTDQAQTASDLCDAINAENLIPMSPLFGLISGNPIVGAQFSIEANIAGLKFQVVCINGLSLDQVNEAYEMVTDDRYVEMVVDVRSGSIAYLETGDEVNAVNGMKKDAGEPAFKIEGRENILRARVIEFTPGAELNYTAYIQE